MNKISRIITSTLLGISLVSVGHAQDQKTDDLKDWYLRDLKADSFYGISLKQAYQFLNNKKHKTVIVGVVDSGIDTTHEDLKSVIYVNPKEIPGNGIDDDHNGYVDDVHGWNFLGNKNGKNLDKDVEEKYRTYYYFKDRFSNPALDTNALSVNDKYDYDTWRRAKEEITDPKSYNEDKQQVMIMENILQVMHNGDSLFQKTFGKDDYTFNDLLNLKTSNAEAASYQQKFLMLQGMVNASDDATINSVIKEIDNQYNSTKRSLLARNTPPAPVRKEIIGDNYFDFSDSHYGNTDVHALDPMHGTHVSGIIAADRTNNIGINGIANDAKILPVRAVPDGDEYDKDIALAIHYAVDNGAKVINMSFGKPYSPQKFWVDSAIAYAASKDVLLIHAAGNDGKNVDSSYNFPNKHLQFIHNEIAPNIITVGASQDPHIESMNIVASFSNYGKKNVDVFAPGVKIYSTVPSGNQYAFLQGTSMASPVVAGIAALIRSYYPTLTAVQVKYVIEHSVVVPDASVKVCLPGDDAPVKLSDLCTSGGIVNAYNAVVLADQMTSNNAKTRHLKTHRVFRPKHS